MAFPCQVFKCGNEPSLMLNKMIQERFTAVIESNTDFLGLLLPKPASLPSHLHHAYLLRANVVLSMTRGKLGYFPTVPNPHLFHVIGLYNRDLQISFKQASSYLRVTGRQNA